MSTVLVVAPLIIANWPVITAAVMAAVGTMGFSVVNGVDVELERSTMETGVTRAEIEDIRGVAMSKGTIDILMEIGWVKIRGRKRTPGRPVTYGTTEAFLVQFGLESVTHLPGLDELKVAGFLEAIPPSGFDVPNPSDELAADEDPYTGEEPEDLATGSVNLDEA